MLQIFLHGLAVGLFVSAPMGPVGILCIQRTLYKGRRTGLYTGIGAAISDFIYCLLTGFGLVFIEDFLESNQDIIKLVGSAVLIGFAIYLFRKNPSVGLRKPEVKPGSPGKDILGGFLFTFSNPLILFLIIGLFARFNFLSPEYKFYHYIIGYMAIIAGALGWWWVVTFFVDKLRAHFNVRSMWLINRGIGILILIFALVGIITGVGSLAGWSANAIAPRIGLVKPGTATRSHIMVRHPNEVYFRVKPEKHRGMAWTVEFSDSASTGIRIEVAEADRKSDSDPVFASGEAADRQALVSVFSIASDSLLLSAKMPKEGLRPRKETAWLLQRRGGNWFVYCGYHEPTPVGTFSLPSFNVSEISFRNSAASALEVSDVRVRGCEELADVATPDSLMLRKIRKETINLEGEWGIYDYDMDADRLSLGGDYLVALRAIPSGYDMFYMEGAVVSAGLWDAGRLKGRLSYTRYPDVYDVEWVDHAGAVYRNAKASLDTSSGYLVFHFPTRNSTLRMRRVE